MAKLQHKKPPMASQEADIVEQTGPAAPADTEDTGPTAVARLAYRLWLERGCPEGSPEEDWYRAERELGVTTKPVEQTVPAVAQPKHGAQRSRPAA